MKTSVLPHVLAEALHDIVIRAVRRLNDAPLRDRLLADEGRRIVAERDHRLRLDEATQRLRAPWRDVFGQLHCNPCGGLIDPRPGYDGRRCTCRKAVVA